MLTQYRFRLTPDRPCDPGPGWGYPLYAALLEHLPGVLGARLHQEGTTPVSQFLVREETGPLWTVTLLGEEAEALAGPLLEALPPLTLRRQGITFTASAAEKQVIAQPEELFLRGAAGRGQWQLELLTPTAFKSRGQYRTLPTPRLLLQSLLKKWNGCFPDCPIEDPTGEGLEAMAAGLRWGEFSLRSQTFPLKGGVVPGFVGSLAVEDRLTGFHRQLADALLVFSGYAGVGIKTALGMGGTRCRPQ